MFRSRWFIISFILLTIFVQAPVYANADQHIRILIDTEELKTDVKPTIVDGRTMVPLRAIFEALEATVDWIPETRTIIGKKDNTVITLQLDKKIARVNNKDVELDVAATVIEGRTFVPIRFIAESMQTEVEWIQQTRTVVITTKLGTRHEISAEIAGLNIEANAEAISNTIKHLTQKPRIVGSEYEREMAVYYSDILKSYGYEVELQEFPFKTLTIDEVIAINRNNAFDFNFTSYNGTGINVIAKKPSSISDNKDTLIIGAHYDSESITNARPI